MNATHANNYRRIKNTMALLLGVSPGRINDQLLIWSISSLEDHPEYLVDTNNLDDEINNLFRSCADCGKGTLLRRVSQLYRVLNDVTLLAKLTDCLDPDVGQIGRVLATYWYLAVPVLLIDRPSEPAPEPAPVVDDVSPSGDDVEASEFGEWLEGSNAV